MLFDKSYLLKQVLRIFVNWEYFNSIRFIISVT